MKRIAAKPTPEQAAAKTAEMAQVVAPPNGRMISAYDRLRIATQIVANPRTVQRVYAGAGSDYSFRRVTEAARQLGLPLPPARSSTSSPEPSPTNSKAA